MSTISPLLAVERLLWLLARLTIHRLLGLLWLLWERHLGLIHLPLVHLLVSHTGIHCRSWILRLQVAANLVVSPVVPVLVGVVVLSNFSLTLRTDNR